MSLFSALAASLSTTLYSSGPGAHGALPDDVQPSISIFIEGSPSHGGTVKSSVILSHLNEERQGVLDEFSGNLKEAANTALSTAAANTPYQYGTARGGWRLSQAGPLQFVIVNLDNPAKIRTLELRHWMLKRAQLAADKQMASKGYGTVQQTPDFTPRW